MDNTTYTATAAAAKKPAKAPRAAKPIKAPKPATKPKADKPLSARAQILANAEAGKLPPAPDFSAATHARFRKRLSEIVGLVEKGDIRGLKQLTINPVSSSPKAMLRYRDLAVLALESQRRQAKKAG
jgi:hypothetical protein